MDKVALTDTSQSANCVVQNCIAPLIEHKVQMKGFIDRF